MKHRCLCPMHSQELKHNPKRALHCWSNSYETASNLVSLGQHNEALPHLAGAFEIAEIVMSQDEVEQEHSMALFTKSALSLAFSLNMLGYQYQKDAVLELAMSHLSKSSQPSNFKTQQIELIKHSLNATHKLH